jgi:hypothetical protein
VSIRFAGPRAGVSLAYELASDVAGDPPLRRPLTSRGGRTIEYRIPAAAARSQRFRAATLVLANGSVSRLASYRLSVR